MKKIFLLVALFAVVPVGYAQEAVELIRQAEAQVRLRPDSAASWLALGKAQARHNFRLLSDDHAEESFRKAIELDPNFAEAYSELGWQILTPRMVFCGNFSYTAAEMEQRREAHKQQCLTAVQTFQRAIQLKPDYADAHKGLGKAYLELEYYADAKTAFSEALLLLPDDDVALEGIRVAFEKLGMNEPAIDALTRLVPRLHHRIDEQREAEQQKAAKQGTKPQKTYLSFNLDHRLWAAYDRLGYLHWKIGQLRSAVKAFQMYVKLMPNSESHYLDLCELYIALGEKQSAMDAWTPASRLINEMLTWLKKRGINDHSYTERQARAEALLVKIRNLK